jgi:hypothetical protein
VKEELWFNKGSKNWFLFSLYGIKFQRREW